MEMANFKHGNHLGGRLVGLVVKASASRVADQGFDYRLPSGDVPGRVIPLTSTLVLKWLACQVNNTSDFNIGTQVASLPGKSYQ